jgi:putative ubiquitin-RnfH superfamily antitoxin RatB of RatAB toxin-antitoxin module
MKVEIAYAGPEGETLLAVDLPCGSTVADAIDKSGIVARLGLFEAALGYAIHGQAARPTTPVVDGDRVELLRPLVADPKDVRRRRALEKPLPTRRPQPKIGRRGG